MKTYVASLRRLKRSLASRRALILNRLYSDRTVIFFEHVRNTKIAPKIPIAIRHVSKENIQDASGFATEKHMKAFERSLPENGKGYFAYLDGRCVHHAWVTFGKKEIKLSKFLSMTIENNQACIEYIKTDASVRGNNICPAVLNSIVNDLNSRCKRFFLYIDLPNIASQRAVKKAGFVEVGRVRETLILGIKIRPLPSVFKYVGKRCARDNKGSCF